ncbi:unnamed protein product [Sphacelaria rigidula]
MTGSSTLIFCFYTGQVEHTRLGIPTSTPLAVQQWDGLIAINYAARKFGVKRGDRTEAAKKKCPEIVFVHVETIGTGEDHRTVGAALPTTRDGGGAGRGGASGGASHDQRSCKVSLERYRVASFAIMAIFQNHCRRVERASIDEAYLDFTEEAAKLCQDAEAGEAPDLENAPETDLQGTAGHRVDPTNAFDRALLAGARLTAAMRLAVEEELGFTVSAGIASNKVLAKLASSRNKPNKQTVVPAGAASEMLDTVPLHNLRGLGGKLGELVGAWSKAETASDLKKFGQDELAAKFGPKTGVWLWRICRGMDDEAVTPNLKPKSLSVCKSFAPIRDRDGVLQWMKLLCQELAHRIGVDRGAWSRRATKLTLQIISSKQGDRYDVIVDAWSRDGWRAAAYTRSRTVDIPGGTEAPSAEALVSEAMSVFDKTENTLPCNRLALTAHEFDSLVSGRGSIASFLRAAPTENKPAAATSSEMNSQEQLSSPSGEMNERCGTSTRSSPFSGKRRGSMHNSSENHGGGGALGAKMTTDAPAAVMAAAAGLTSESTVRVGDSESSSVAKAPRSTGEASLMSTMTSAVVVAATGREGAWGEDVWEGEERSPCTKCGVFIEAGLMPEHLDFHYAQDLQQRYSREGDVARDRASISRTEEGGGRGRGSTAVGGGVGRRTSTKAGNVGPTRRIDSFFKPL